MEKNFPLSRYLIRFISYALLLKLLVTVLNRSELLINLEWFNNLFSLNDLLKIFIPASLIAAVEEFIFLLRQKDRKDDLKVKVLLILLLILALLSPSLLAQIGLWRCRFLEIGVCQILSLKPWFFQTFVLSICLSYFIAEFLSCFQIKINSKISRYWPWLIFLLGFILYSVLSVQRHQLYHSFTMDLAGYDQAVWLMSRFLTPASSIYHYPNLLGDHFEPALMLISPLYWLISDVRSILIFQAFAVSLAVFPLYRIAKRKLKSDLAASCLALGYLFFIGIQDAIEFDFHPLTLVPPLLAYIYDYLDRQRMLKYYISVLICLLMKEVTAIYIVFFGIYGILRRYYKVGLITVALGVAWYLFAIKLMVPYLSGSPYGHINAYHALGNGATEIITTIFTRPLYTLKIMITPDTKIMSFLSIFGSVTFLPFFAPYELVLTLPMLGEKFLTSDRESNWVMWWHYSSTIAPVMIIAAASAIRNISHKIKLKIIKLEIVLGLSVLISTLLVAFVFYQDGPFTVPLGKVFTRHFYQKNEHLKKVDQVLKLIPQEASVTAQDSIAPHLSHRKEIYRMQSDVPRADFIVWDSAINYWPWKDEGFLKIKENLMSDPEYEIFIQEETTYIFKKKS